MQHWLFGYNGLLLHTNDAPWDQCWTQAYIYYGISSVTVKWLPALPYNQINLSKYAKATFSVHKLIPKNAQILPYILIGHCT